MDPLQRVISMNHTFGLIKGMFFRLKLEWLCCYGDGSLKMHQLQNPAQNPIKNQSTCIKTRNIKILFQFLIRCFQQVHYRFNRLPSPSIITVPTAEKLRFRYQQLRIQEADVLTWFMINSSVIGPIHLKAQDCGLCFDIPFKKNSASPIEEYWHLKYHHHLCQHNILTRGLDT